ncbi:hypothetical protein BTA51_13780 [Hahella sp. CCB-MM4]|uniref:DUF2269 family protein n=1 Tax=Hahella sp. (strain CCB-MM4) TaxID=1926491 RepID=UPI000B9AD1A5|nr:DUF2269 domain-containing protein [Hahella sp. CCB-MM4]OZG73018.1 hypothetical protein BTA51_13780 [Hahella sp. CCB-MM4]
MNLYLIVKTLHILSATVLFGTGLGIAFFMFRSMFTDDLQQKYYAARSTVLADYLFTFPAAVFQSLSGVWLVWYAGFNWTDTWLAVTYILYLLAALCWLPVVWIQIQLRKLIEESIRTGDPLPERYHRLFRIWFMLGWPAFFGLTVIFYLMVAKPL